jgi:disulfide bond formation protein DsbB
MTEQILFLNYWVSVGTLLMEASVVILLLYFIYLKVDKESANDLIKPITNIAEKVYGSIENAIILKIFVLSLAASAMTLYYSEVLGVIPCALCWFGRIFMYGTVLISGTALFARNNLEQRGIFRYILVFSVLGAVTSLYHHFLQMAADYGTNLPCPASGGDCAKRIIFEFGHITFPWMAFVLFVLFILMILLAKKISPSR